MQRFQNHQLFSEAHHPSDRATYNLSQQVPPRLAMEGTPSRSYHVLEVSSCGSYVLVADYNHIVVARLTDGGGVRVDCLGDQNGVRCAAWCSLAPPAFVATTDEDKKMRLWVLVDDEQWKETHTWTSPKRISSLAISLDGAPQVLYATKFGEVWSVQVPLKSVSTKAVERTQETTPPTLRLGHVSVITSLVLTSDAKYLLSSDRDEKIRTSHWPNAYDIEEFCLGHTQFVSRVVEVSPREDDVDARLAISGGGDGTLRLWDYVAGRQLDLVTCSNPEQGCNPSTVVPLCWCPTFRVAAVLVESSFDLALFAVEKDTDAQWKLAPRGNVDVGHQPLAAQFDARGVLWLTVVAPEGGSAVFALAPTEDIRGERATIAYSVCEADTTAALVCAALCKVEYEALKIIPTAFAESLKWESMRKHTKVIGEGKRRRVDATRGS